MYDASDLELLDPVVDDRAASQLISSDLGAGVRPGPHVVGFVEWDREGVQDGGPWILNFQTRVERDAFLERKAVLEEAPSSPKPEARIIEGRGLDSTLLNRAA
jgi:hypothetical protein